MAIKVVELFAGVGGFRIGLEGFPRKKNSSFQVVWSNQWEPSTKTQHANMVYKEKWPKSIHVGEDIASVKVADIPNHSLLCGGFPCQDYSVATTLKSSGGLIGKKGVLWWQIYRILEEKGKDRPQYLMLENVDRLLKSPAKQRGRDFAMILSSLSSLGYAVEWRVINAAEYGMPQRRRRTYIIGYHTTTSTFKALSNAKNKWNWLSKDGIIAKSFPVTNNLINESEINLSSDLVKLSNNFNCGHQKEEFEDTGIMVKNRVYTAKTSVNYQGNFMTLGDVLIPLENVDREFLIDENTLEKWKYLKGAKKEKRYNIENDFWYEYSEGGMVFPDSLDNASRTIITGEGGASPSRFKHVVNQNGTLRRLTPIELERLNMFPDNHTKLADISNTKRAFFMGNALVVGVIEKLGVQLAQSIMVRGE